MNEDFEEQVENALPRLKSQMVDLLQDAVSQELQKKKPSVGLRIAIFALATSILLNKQ